MPIISSSACPASLDTLKLSVPPALKLPAAIRAPEALVFEAPNDETAASVLLAADMLGNIRTQTMRAFTSSEMKMILDKAP